MRRRMTLIGVVIVVALVVVVPVALAGGAYRGSAWDANNPELGLIEYLATPAGYHFWFTPTADVGQYYEADHSYHNIYQLTVDDPAEWCGTVIVGAGDREPYNLVGHQGETAYYKIYDTTTDTLVCP